MNVVVSVIDLKVRSIQRSPIRRLIQSRPYAAAIIDQICQGFVGICQLLAGAYRVRGVRMSYSSCRNATRSISCWTVMASLTAIMGESVVAAARS